MFVDYLINPSHYKEEKIIGEGNFSSVTLAYSKSNHDIKVALKKIPIDSDEKETQKYFVREVSVMSDLQHPCLIKLVGFSLPSENDSYFKIYSEYLPNGTLLNALREDESKNMHSRVLTPTIRSKIIYGIASGMKYLHKMRIVHRDLKPENVFLDKFYQPIISDFGLSKFCTDDLVMTKKLGTPYYMAPELFSDETDEPITNKIDVYAFALTLLSIFSTKFSFVGRQPRSINQLVNNILNGKRYVIPDDVPEFYRSLIQKCWAHNPLERPSFEQIIRSFDESDDFILNGSNVEEVHNYMDSLQNHDIDLKMNQTYNSTSTSSSSDYENDQEETPEFDFDYY